MSEFLKNFRTAHSRFPGNKRSPYDGHYYPAQERRNGNDRRSDQHAAGKPPASIYTKAEELVPVFKDLLETIIKNQQILIDMRKEFIEEKDAFLSVFKEIALSLQKNQTSQTSQTSPIQPLFNEDDESGFKTTSNTIEELEKTEMKSSADEKKDIIRIMKKLRKKGGTYKEIAMFLNENNIPTFSNKGNWHAQTIHRLCSR